jgi:hypothetical protein
MTNTFEFVEGSDLRIRFDAGTALWTVEQVKINGANGATDPGDLARIIDLGIETWEPRYAGPNLANAALVAISISLEEGSRIRATDLGPFTGNSPLVSSAVSVLTSLL